MATTCSNLRLKPFLGGIADAFEDRNFRFYSVGSIVSWLSYFVHAAAVVLAEAAPNIALMRLSAFFPAIIDSEYLFG